MKKPSRKLMRQLLVAAAVALVVLAVIGIFFLGHVVQTGINTALPLVTGTPSSVGKCRIYPLQGKLYLRDFVIGNPPGYQTPHAFALKEMKIKLNAASLFSDRIQIREILVDGLAVSYETALTESNVGRIKEHIDQLAGKKSKEEEATPAEAETKPGKKLQIDDLLFRNGEVTLSATVLGQNAGGTMPLPEIRLTGIGQEGDGASTAEAAEEIFSALYKAIMETVASMGKVDPKELEHAADALGDAASGAVEGVKKLWE